VTLTGRLSDEQLVEAYQAADVFMLPTLALECFGLISIEAMAFGCPVFASDSSAIPETLRPFRPDLLFPAGDTEALRRLVAGWLEGRLTLPDADTVVGYVDSHYSQEVIVPRLLALLEREAG
jgi:glycosyltransferase involved in cell wall biosynthesis